MQSNRKIGLSLVLFGTAIFLSLTIPTAITSSRSVLDFKTAYYSAKCLLLHRDPYASNEILRVEGGESRFDTDRDRFIFTKNQYPPTEFILVAPFALLEFGVARGLWIALICGSFLMASYLVWDYSARFAPVVAGCLVGFIVANSEILVLTGNPAGIALGLCVIAVWCFLSERFVPIGVTCLAISLAVKPQDVGFIWLYFLLAGGRYRKLAIQTVVLLVAFGAPFVIWVNHVSPHWMYEIQNNMRDFSSPGGLNDPAAPAAGGLGMVTDLQMVISLFCSDPHLYNLISYALSVPIILVWMRVAMRKSQSPQLAWMALAAAAAISILPIYHRQYDAKIILLAVPACTMLWAARGVIGRSALLITSAAFVLVGDLPWTVYIAILPDLRRSFGWLYTRILSSAQVAIIPVALLAMGLFYLWVYARRSDESALVVADVQ